MRSMPSANFPSCPLRYISGPWRSRKNPPRQARHAATLCYAMLRSSCPRTSNDHVRKPRRNWNCCRTWQFNAVYGCPSTRHSLRRHLNILLSAVPHAITGSQDTLEDGTIKLISSEGTEPQRTTQQSTVIRSNWSAAGPTNTDTAPQRT